MQTSLSLLTNGYLVRLAPKSSWPEVIFITLAVAAVVAFYFWFARSQAPAKPRPLPHIKALSLRTA
jgi:hypothetical protein